MQFKRYVLKANIRTQIFFLLLYNSISSLHFLSLLVIGLVSLLVFPQPESFGRFSVGKTAKQINHVMQCKESSGLLARDRLAT